MMKNASLLFSFLVVTTSSLWAAPTALDALTLARREAGGAPLNDLVEIVGYEGRTQPREWVITVQKSGRDQTLHEIKVYEGKISSSRASDAFYPEKIPFGVVSVGSVKIDSSQVFRIVNEEAKKALIGFDYVDYVLRAQELTTKPLWIVKLRNEDEELLGALYISAEDGAVLRRVWLYSTDDPNRSVGARVDNTVRYVGGKIREAGSSIKSIFDRDDEADEIDPAEEGE